jgi:hypothetical protein
VNGNGIPEGDASEDVEEWAKLVIALDKARDEAEAGVAAINYGDAVARFIGGIAAQLAQPFPPAQRKDVELAIARGCSAVIATIVQVYFNPELAQ